MSKIRSKNTKPELALRKALFARGFRYRVNVPNLPGKPDIVLPKYKTVIFLRDDMPSPKVFLSDSAMHKTTPREVYNGVNLSRFTPGDTSGRLREKYHLPDDVMPVGNIGRVLPWKNQYDYLRVAERLLQYHPKLHSGSRTSPVQRTAGAGKGQSPAGRSDLPFDR